MKYRHFVSAQPVPPSRIRPGSVWAGDGGAFEPSEVHPLAPTLHFVHPVPAHVERHIRAAAARAHLNRASRRALVEAVQEAALQVGYAATVGLSAATAGGLPSFPGLTVGTNVLLIDLVPG